MIQRTISAMVGKGSINHNCRKFTAENVDPSRSHLNIEYCNEDLHEVYHELFDAAVERYNAKQKRKDRMIDDYYEKIRSGKQEKLFHEIIIQIGDRESCGAATEDGQLAAEILDEYMKEFQERNPNLRVFSAHLHMDEATPHLHIDFVPYTAGSTRGLDTRVSLKKALAAQGFSGGTRSETEWNQWVNAEKEALAAVMERHEVAWEKKGTHEEHLSVLEFKKKERAAEVAELEEQKLSLETEVMDKEEVKAELDNEIADTGEKVRKARQKFEAAQADLKAVEAFAAEHIRDPEEWLPEAAAFEGAKAYRKRIMPLFKKVVKLIQPLYTALVDLKRKYRQAADRNRDLEGRISRLHDEISDQKAELKELRVEAQNMEYLKKSLGASAVEKMIIDARRRLWAEVPNRKQTRDPMMDR